MSDKEVPIIIIKKKKKVVEEGHHGGAWKVAYADFVTAMMAFFLLLWLLNATTKEQKEGIAKYFNPVSISETNSGGEGAFAGKDVSEAEGLKNTPSFETTSPVELGPKPLTPDRVDEEEIKESERIEKQRFETMQAQIMQNLSEDKLSELGLDENLREHLTFNMTEEGLEIQVHDEGNKPVFFSGNDQPTNRMKIILGVVAKILNEVPNELVITGHTDSSQYSDNNSYSNWELSADRANSVRRFFTSQNIEQNRFIRVEGKADTELFVENDPYDVQNRRIGITVVRSGLNEK